MHHNDKRRVVRLAKIRESNRVLRSLNFPFVLCMPGQTDQIMAKSGDNVTGINLAKAGEMLANEHKSLGLKTHQESVMAAQLLRWIRSYRRLPVSVWAEWLGSDHPAVRILNATDYGDQDDTSCVQCGSGVISAWIALGTAKDSGPICKHCNERPANPKDKTKGTRRDPLPSHIKMHESEKQFRAEIQSSSREPQSQGSSPAPW